MKKTLIKTLILSFLLTATIAVAAEYRIGPEDVLQVSFWQDNVLNTQVRVRLDGTISLDIIGEIEAVGKTTVELQDEIVRSMSRLNKRISQAVVRVVEYNSQYVFVTGQVNVPGKKTYEAIPDLLTVINEAGWITEQGDLSRVTIIRGGDRAGGVEVVDMASAIADGETNKLPRLYAGDAVDIPSTPTGIPARSIATGIRLRNAFYVIGAVTSPGPITYEENVDVLEAISLAGGPTDNADLKKTRVISKDGPYAQTMKIDMEKYFETGQPARYIMQKEDVVVVPARKGSVWRSIVEYATPALGALTSALLLYETLKDDNN
ncbi:MAG TPA: polysaccharide biosynthesis/export family protein [candidate division Zixibacteria bacterium]|nr:polysaccharide biosynthesis/export family protein [candidate division Zixibacteria bacterium]